MLIEKLDYLDTGSEEGREKQALTWQGSISVSQYNCVVGKQSLTNKTLFKLIVTDVHNRNDTLQQTCSEHRNGVWDIARGLAREGVGGKASETPFPKT